MAMTQEASLNKSSALTLTRWRCQGWRDSGRLLIMLLAVLLLGIGSFSVGRYGIPPRTVVAVIAAKLWHLPQSWGSEVETVLWRIRLPRITAALLVGCALSVSGAAYQGLFRNPMVSPDILGVSAGASCGAAIGILLARGPAEVQALAFAGGLAAVSLTGLITLRIGRRTGGLGLILVGIIVGGLFTAGLSILKYVADPDNALPAITYWLMGGLSAVGNRDLTFAAPPIVAGTVLLLLLRWPLNILSFGEEEARALGFDTRLLGAAVIVASTLVTAASVAMSGVVGLVGLVVPHIARALVGPNFRLLLPAAALVGAGFLLLMDDLARSLFASEIPLGVLTELVGAPFFLCVLARAQNGWDVP